MPNISSCPAVSVMGATKTFGSGHNLVCALREIDLGVERGRMTPIMGQSGLGNWDSV